MKSADSLRPIFYLAFAGAFAGLLPHTATAQGGGSLVPLAPPGPTMKSLDEVEARTPISAAPFVITESGSYYLTKPLHVSNGDGITINADHVTLDLNGFTVSSATAQEGHGILVGAQTSVAIKNGGIFRFHKGLQLDGAQNVKVDRIRVSWSNEGIDISSKSAVSQTLHFTNSHVHYCTNSGIYIRGTSHPLRAVTFSECSVVDTFSNSVTVLSSDGGPITSLRFLGCEVIHGSHAAVTVRPSGDATINGLVFRDCIITEPTSDGIVLDTGSQAIAGCRIQNCEIIEPRRSGIVVSGSKAKGVRIDSNTLIKTVVGGTGIQFKDSGFANIVTRNFCMNFLQGYDLGGGVSYGPIVTSFLELGGSGAEDHPMANFSR